MRYARDDRRRRFFHGLWEPVLEIGHLFANFLNEGYITLDTLFLKSRDVIARSGLCDEAISKRSVLCVERETASAKNASQ
jgi:hypothetical protein